MTGDSVYKSTNVRQIQQICGIGSKICNLYTKREARGPARLKFLPLARLQLAKTSWGGRKNLGGFTLIETLVALTLFSVVVTIGTDLFFTFQRLSQRTEALESMVSTSRFIVERVAREVREGTIDYPSFTLPISGAQNALYLSNNAGAPFNFAYSADTNNLTLTVASGSESLTPAGVNIRNFAFYIFPKDDPFTFDLARGDFAADKQPRVTLFMSLDNGLPENDRNYTRYDVQTTISSRAYLR